MTHFWVTFWTPKIDQKVVKNPILFIRRFNTIPRQKNDPLFDQKVIKKWVKNVTKITVFSVIFDPKMSHFWVTFWTPKVTKSPSKMGQKHVPKWVQKVTHFWVKKVTQKCHFLTLKSWFLTTF